MVLKHLVHARCIAKHACCSWGSEWLSKHMRRPIRADMHAWHAVDTQAGISGHTLLEAVAAAEREVAASAAQEPRGEWECVRVRPVYQLAAGLPADALSTPADAAAALQVSISLSAWDCYR